MKKYIALILNTILSILSILLFISGYKYFYNENIIVIQLILITLLIIQFLSWIKYKKKKYDSSISLSMITILLITLAIYSANNIYCCINPNRQIIPPQLPQ